MKHLSSGPRLTGVQVERKKFTSARVTLGALGGTDLGHKAHRAYSPSEKNLNSSFSKISIFVIAFQNMKLTVLPDLTVGFEKYAMQLLIGISGNHKWTYLNEFRVRMGG